MERQLSDAQCNAVREDAQRFLASRPDIGPADLAQHTNLAQSTVRCFLRGNIPGGINVVAEIDGAVAKARQGAILQPGGRECRVIAEQEGPAARMVRQGPFYETQTARRIAEVLDYCAENAAIGIITADFGAGKTEGVKAWRRKRPSVDSIVFEFDEFTAANKIETLRMICESLGVEERISNQNAGAAFRVLCSALRESPCLIIFDQCEMLRPRVCQVIRQIWDRTADAGVGVAMLAAPIMISRMLAGKMADMGALTSRVGIWAPLQGIGRAEMAAIVKQEGFVNVEDSAFDMWFKYISGSMRRLMRSLDLLKAKHAGKPITEKTVAGLAGSLWGMNGGNA